MGLANKLGVGGLLIAALFASALPAAAQKSGYPSQPIKIAIPSPPGATTDALARIVADKFQRKWGQPAIVENFPGAGGNIGAEVAYKANPDGYTLLFSYPSPLVVNKSLYEKLSYDPDRFEPVSLMAIVPLVLAVHPNVAATSVQQLIAFAKANPSRLNYASQGYGTTGHLAGELFKSLAGVQIVHVPYKGSAPALTDLLGGQVQMMFIELSTVLPNIRAGTLRALGVGSEKRSSLLPDVPAMAEVLPKFEASTWFGMVAPPKTPIAIVNQLAAAMAAIVHEPDVAKRLVDISADAVGGSPAEMAAFMHDERERWGTVIRETGATAK